jgi:hypothetical protein
MGPPGSVTGFPLPFNCIKHKAVNMTKESDSHKLPIKKIHQKPKHLNADNLEAEALKIIAIIATSRKVTCSIPDGVIGIFIDTILPVAL